MVSAAIARGTGAATSATHAFSLTIDGNDLINYVDWHSIRVSMSARIEDNSSMTFTLTNTDGTLDFYDFWGAAPDAHAAWPLREVRFHDNTVDEPLFGGYITNLKMRHASPARSFIDVTCIGYSWLLDAGVLIEDESFAVGSDGGIQRSIALCGLPGGVTARSGSSTDISDPDNPGIKYDDVINGATADPLVIPAGTTLRGCIAQIASRGDLPIVCYIDNFKRLCITDNVLGTTVVAATFDPATYAVESIEYEWEFSEYVSHVYLKSTTAAGTGWYSAREYIGTSGPVLDDTYLPSPWVAAYVNDNASLDPDYIEVDGGNYIGRAQTGLVPEITLTKSGTYRRLAQRFGVDYPQFGPTGGVEKFGLTYYTLTFEQPVEEHAVLQMRLSSPSDLGSGGRVRTDATGPDADQFPSPPRTRTTAEARRRRHKRRKR